MTEIELPVRTLSQRAVTMQRWNTRNRQLIEEVLHGLRALGHPEQCRTRDFRGYAHAHQVAAAHAKHHGCPRYTAAMAYTQAARP